MYNETPGMKERMFCRAYLWPLYKLFSKGAIWMESFHDSDRYTFMENMKNALAQSFSWMLS